MSARTRVVVIGGGRNCEHEVSLASAAAVADALDPTVYEVVRLTIGDAAAEMAALRAMQATVEPLA